MTLGLVYGYGQLKDGQIDGQTTERCRKALNLYESGKIQRIYITVSAEKNGIRMGQGMKQFFLDHSVPEEHVIFDPRGGNTAGETDVFLSLAKDHVNGESFKAIPISTWYHIPRIWWLWLSRKRLVSVGISWNEAHWADLRIEPVKLAYALLRPHRSSKVVS